MGEPAASNPDGVNGGDFLVPSTAPIKRYPKNVTAASLRALKPRKKGDPGLPGAGRPRGSFAERARAATNDGQTLIDTMVKISKGGPNIRPIDQVAATEWLADRGFGKAQQIIKLEVEDPLISINLNVLSNEQLAALRATLRLALAGGSAPDQAHPPALGQSRQDARDQEPA